MVRSKIIAFAICVPIVIMAAKCDGAAITCPSLKNYSKAEQEQALREYELVEKMAPMIIRMINDYVDLRAAIKKCIARRDK